MCVYTVNIYIYIHIFYFLIFYSCYVMCYKNIKVEAVHILFRFKMTGGESPAVLLSSSHFSGTFSPRRP